MASLDTVSIAILLGSLLVLAGILSSLIALRFGAPLLLVFLLVGILAGEGGPGGIKFDNVGVAYLVGSIALALFLTLLLVDYLGAGGQSWSHAFVVLARDLVFGCIIGYGGGRIIAWVLNRLELPQGLHAPFVAVAALVVFAFGNAVHTSGFLAVYLAGLVVGNRQTRAHNSVVVFLDAVTWLAQIVMFVLLGLLAWPHRLAVSVVGSVVVALVLMLIARPAAVFLCLAPFGFQPREKLFMSWVGLRGAVAIFLASIPLLVGLPAA